MVPLFLLALLLITGCDLSGVTVTTTSELPLINSFSADPSTISAGASSSLNWTVRGATTVSIDQGIGNVALTGPRAVSPAATTTYTLTASNAAGSTTATTQVIISGAAPPPPATGTLPVINSFTASSTSIIFGGSTTLTWSVSNATSITIDNGIGAVGSTGSVTVSPATSTTYTLTASNTTGLQILSVTVLVSAAPAAGIPDLVITDIVRSGDTITYTITNQGDAAAAPSISTLKVDGVVVANDNVGSMAPGESRTEIFAGYAYSCSLPGDALVAKADNGGVVIEGSEANNEYTKSWSCLVIVGPMFTLKPDLVIEDIWKVSEITGDKIYYKIKNEGSVASGTSTTALYIYPCIVPCPPKATDSVPSIAAGASITQKFATYNYTGAGFSVGVKADYDEAIDESDDGNNSLSKPEADL